MCGTGKLCSKNCKLRPAGIVICTAECTPTIGKCLLLVKCDERNTVQENCTRLGYYAASSGNSLPTFRGNLSVPSSDGQIHNFLVVFPVFCNIWLSGSKVLREMLDPSSAQDVSDLTCQTNIVCAMKWQAVKGGHGHVTNTQQFFSYLVTNVAVWWLYRFLMCCSVD